MRVRYAVSWTLKSSGARNFLTAGFNAKPRKQMTLKRPFLNEFRLNFFSMISTHFEEFNYHIDFSVESLYFLIS